MELLILIHQLSEVTVTANQIKNWTETDPILSQVHCFVLHRWPNIVDNKQTPKVRKKTQRKVGMRDRETLRKGDIVPERKKESVITNLLA